MKLRVWEDAISLYRRIYPIFSDVPFEFGKTASNMIASADSVHRNIAEGYCRRSIREYLHFLNIALGSLGETVSALHAYRGSDRLHDDEFDSLDELSCKLENGLLRLVESLERKRNDGDWNESLIVKEQNAVYGSHQSSNPPIQ